MEGLRLLLTPEAHNDSDAGGGGGGGRQLAPQHGAPPRLKDLSGIFFMVALNVLALVANTAVMAVILKAPHLRKFAFVGHLCAVDLLCGALLMPLGILCRSPYFSGLVFSALECRLYASLNVFLVAASIFTITAISVERYYYIVHPMRYELRMTRGLTAAVVALVWLASAALGLASALGWPPAGGDRGAARCSLQWSGGDHRWVMSLLFCVACFCLPALVLFAVYCNVYKVARVAARPRGPPPSWTVATQKSRSDSISSQTTIVTTQDAPPQPARERPFGGGKAALTLVAIVGQFLVCWLPYFAFHFRLSLETSSAALDDLGDLEDTVTWLAYSSFAINPFFYGLLNRQIREELDKLRRCYTGRPTQLFLSSHEASGHENFLQFLHRTSCTVDTRASFTASSSPRTTLDRTPQPEVRIPGQIPEELN